MSCGIYRYTNLINGKRYIGQSINIEKRYGAHLWFAENKSDSELPYFERAIKKYGIDNFRFEILEFCTPDELNDLETYWIDYYQTCCVSTTYDGYGYNLTTGGGSSSGYKLFYDVWNKGKTGVYTEEQIKRISDGTIKGMHKPEHWENYINSIKNRNMYGENNPFFGKHHTQEALDKMNRTGMKHSDETISEFKKRRGGGKWMNKDGQEFYVYKERIDEYVEKGYSFGRIDSTKEKLRVANLGKKDAPETIEKKRNAFLGSKNPNYGKHWKLDKNTRKRIYIENE